MPAAHRLRLTADELALLAAGSGLDLPREFRAPESLPRTGPESAAEPDAWLTECARADVGLRRRGLLDGGGNPIPSVAANFAVLGAAAVTVHTQVTVGAHTRTALHTLSGGLGAGLIADAGPEIELSLFPAWDLPTELSRAVPDPPQPPAAAIGPQPVSAAAPQVYIAAANCTHAERAVPVPHSGSRIGVEPDSSPAGVLLPAAVGGAAAAAGPGGAGRGPMLGVAQREDGVGAVADVDANGREHVPAGQPSRVLGTLRSVVIGADRATVHGTVEWVVTEAGWTGLRDSGEGGPCLEAVRPSDLGSWLAPALDAATDRTRSA
jgi:hypothetical protein